MIVLHSLCVRRCCSLTIHIEVEILTRWERRQADSANRISCNCSIHISAFENMVTTVFSDVFRLITEYLWGGGRDYFRYPNVTSFPLSSHKMRFASDSHGLCVQYFSLTKIPVENGIELPGEEILAYSWIEYRFCTLGRDRSIRPLVIFEPIESWADCCKFSPFWIIKKMCKNWLVFLIKMYARSSCQMHWIFH